MTLRASIPKEESLRLKAYIYGPAGYGKTLAALQFPNAYIIDTAKETTRYAKLIRDKNSEVFHCSDPYEILKELYVLGEEKHRFRTIIIDEITTLYQNLQTIWTDKFIEAAEKDNSKNSKSVLLQDFGIRYWNKVKRDWRRIIDALMNLDMNVVVNAHQKDKYGPSQAIIGITSDSEKNDEYIFDFVFRLIKRGQKFKAITEKQRVLPIEIDPESRQFPNEFSWNYDTIIKFYNREYLESESLKDIKTTKAKKDNKIQNKVTPGIQNKAKQDNKSVKQSTDDKIINSKNHTNIDKIKFLLKENEIPTKSFKIFLREVCKWNYLKKLSTLKERDQNIVLTRWDKIKTEYFKNIKKNTNNTTETQNNKQTTPIANYEPNKPIREDQKKIIIQKLSENNLDIKTLFNGFSIKKWEEINQEGANNMIKNFDVMLGNFIE